MLYQLSYTPKSQRGRHLAVAAGRRKTDVGHAEAGVKGKPPLPLRERDSREAAG